MSAFLELIYTTMQGIFDTMNNLYFIIGHNVIYWGWLLVALTFIYFCVSIFWRGAKK